MIARQSILGRDTERLIALLRVILAGAGLVAAYFDVKHAKIEELAPVSAYALLGGAVLVTQSGLGRPTLAKALHVLDVFFASLMIIAPGGAGYFLILATFCLLSSVIQWRWRVVLGTGAILLGVYLGAIGLKIIGAERMTIRTTYLAVLPVCLALAARNAEASRARLLKLARWSSGRYSTPGDAVLRVFRHAADVMEAEEITVFYHEVDATAPLKAIFYRKSDKLETQSSDAWAADTISADLDNQSFLVVDPEQDLCLTYAGMRRVANPTPALPLTSRSNVVASAPFTGDFCQGRLFACGIKSWRWDQLVLVEIVASHVRSRLEGRTLRDRAARITAELERMRLSRDLHDGILQSLTAARLQLRSLMKDAPQDTEDRLHMIADLLQDEQQRLREFIEDTRAAPGELVPVARVADRIKTVADHWRLKADIDLDCGGAEISSTLYREIYFMVGEAIANSARHGGATRISARLQCADRRLVLVINEEDGKAGEETVRGMVPRSINERLKELGGSLALSRGARGLSLRLEMPVDD